MAPSKTSFEVIEISDEEPPSSGVPARSGSQISNGSARKQKHSDSVKRNLNLTGPHKPERASRELFERYGNTSTPFRDGDKHVIRWPPGGSSQPIRKSKPAQFPLHVPSSPSAKVREGAAQTLNVRQKASQPAPKRISETIVLDESETEEPAQKVKKSFYLPSGFEPILASPSSRNDIRHPHDNGSASPRKRALERDSPVSAFSPSKRLKLDPGAEDENTLRQIPKIISKKETANPPVAENKTNQPTASKASIQNGAVKPIPHPPARIHKTPLDDLGDRNGPANVSAKSVDPTRKSNGITNGISTSKESVNDRSLQSERNENSPGLLRTRKEVSDTPVRRNESLTLSKNTALRDQRKSVTSEDGAFSSGVSTSLPLRREKRDNKGATQEHRSPAVSKIKDTTTLSLEARPARQDSNESPSRTLRKSGTSTPQHNTVRQSKEAPPGSPDPLNNLPQQSPLRGSPSTSMKKSTRKISPEEDQGYVSLSSSNGEHSVGNQAEDTALRPGKPPKTLESVEAHSSRSLALAADDREHTASGNMRASSSPKKLLNHDLREADEADLQLKYEASQSGATQEVAMADSETAFTHPAHPPTIPKVAALFARLPLANRVERTLGAYLEELRLDNEHWTSVSLRRARLTKDTSTAFSESSHNDAEERASFVNLKPLPLLPHKKGSPTTPSSGVWGIQRIASDGKPQAQTEVTATYTTFATDQQDVPNYAHYVSITNNLLAPNIVRLHCWPYFGDDFDMRDAHNLHDQYTIDIMDRDRKLLLLLQAQKYEEYVESALQDLQCSWADVLRFLLEPDPDVGPEIDARKAYQNRSLYCQEDFSRTSERWKAILKALPLSTPEKLGRAAVLCENFQKMAKFSLWHVARRSKFATLPEEVQEATESHPSDNELTCRICLRFNCPYHGQFKHRPDDQSSDSDSESASVDDAVATDIIHPLRANYRSRITFPPEKEHLEAEPRTSPKGMTRKKQRDPNYWSGYRHKAEERGPFYPCSHPGVSCSDAKCSCFAKMIPCEKSCSCELDCYRKFKGCSCGHRKGHQMVCFENADCACWQLGRECDPDLCGACGVCEVVDPVNKYDSRILIGRCRNASIQRGVPKHTLLGDSGVHGLGLYACEDIKQNDFVGEYKGEIITKKEADRRGAVYEHQKLSYLFSLNKSQEIDSTYFGNKVRFINHAHADKANLYPRIIMVNTVHRIALYAGKDILAGKELLFDYGPFFPDEQLQGKNSKKSAPESKKSAPHVRNANLVKEFYDVSESEDEDGILRAKAVSRAGGAGSKQKAKKPRSGARSGVGKEIHSLPKSNGQGSSRALDEEQGGEQDAGERLAAFNISDETPSEAVDADARIAEDEDDDEEDDEAFEPDDSDGIESEESEEVERSDLDDEDEDEEDDEDLETGYERRRRAAVGTRQAGRG